MKILKIGGAWLAIIAAYILMANMYPAFTGLTDVAVVNVEASGNMSNQPGIVTGLQVMPLLFWFIPAGIGIVATVVTLREGKD